MTSPETESEILSAIRAELWEMPKTSTYTSATYPGAAYPGGSLEETSFQTIVRLPLRDEEAPEAGKPGLARSSAIMALGTIVSRVTGVVRTMVIVAALGTGSFADAYNIPNTVPNMLYILLVGGALNSVLVPQLVRSMREDKDGGEAYANRLLTLTIAVLGVVTLLAVLLAPEVIRLTSDLNGPGQQAEFNLAVTLARYCLPQIFFYGLFTIVGQILNARDRFGAMMWTPILNNVIVIAAFGLYIAVAGAGRTSVTITPAQVRLIGIGTTLGIVVQALTLIPYLRAAGFRVAPRFDWRGVGLRKVGTLAKWTLLFVFTNQVAYTVVTRLSSGVGRLAQQSGLTTGVGYTPYSNAQLLWMLPQSVFTVSLITALLPRMSRAVAEQRFDSVRDDISYALRATGVVIVPCAFFFLFFARETMAVMFLRGSTTPDDVTVMGHMLMAFSLGLIPFSTQYLMLRGFFAFEDTKTPFKANFWIAVTNAVLSVACYQLLSYRWAVTGMAASYTIAYAIGLVVTARYLRKKVPDLDSRRVVRTYLRLGVAAALGGGIGLGIARLCESGMGSGELGSFVAILAGGGTMIVGFVLAARVMRITELTDMVGMVKGRVGR